VPLLLNVLGMKTLARLVLSRGLTQVGRERAESDDEAVPMHQATMLHDGIANSTLVVIDGGDHAPNWARPLNS